VAKCPNCGAGMTALFGAMLCCDAECDLPPEKRTAKLTDASKIDFSKITKAVPTHPYGNSFGGWATILGLPSTWFPGGGNGSWVIPIPATPTGGHQSYSPADNQCKDPYCRATGTKTHVYGILGNYYHHYKCSLCTKEWDVADASNQISLTVN